MIAQKITHSIARIREMGIRKASMLIIHKIKKALFARIWRKRWHNGFTFHTVPKKVIVHPAWYKLVRENVLNGSIKQSSITILGFGTYSFPPNATPWHTDFTSQAQSPSHWATAFYTDIAIPNNTNVDIKIPWELSRLHHLVVCTDAATFTATIDSWMQHNRFLTGVNWFNPMEVGIRAINLIWTSLRFRNNPAIADAWWQKFDGMLYSHKVFLKSNWEVSDRPNNHFLADLLGLAYLECFLNLDIKKTYRTLLNAITQQLLPDGTAYEGSTAYHRLVTEMVWHATLLGKYFHGGVPAQLAQQLAQMQEFITDCTDDAGNFVMIGDNDGGKII